MPISVKLRSPSYLVLGMVRLGVTSGYAIKKATDMSTRHFFATSLAQIYPELARLTKGGLLTRHEDPKGGRSRSAYKITANGERALQAWLRSERFAAPQFRNSTVFPVAQPLATSGVRHPYTVARLGVDLYGFTADWLDRCASELEQEDR